MSFSNSASPGAKFFVNYWDGLRQGRAMPAKRDIDPGVIEHLLGDIILIEREDDGAHVVRLAGERVRDSWGRTLKSCPFASLFAGNDRLHLAALLDAALEEALPCAAHAEAELIGGAGCQISYVFAPLLGTEGRRTSIMTLCEKTALDGADLEGLVLRQWFTAINPPLQRQRPVARRDHLRLVVHND